MELTIDEQKRLLNYTQSLEDVEGDLAVLTAREIKDLRRLQLKSRGLCPSCECCLQVWYEMLGEHICFDEE